MARLVRQMVLTPLDQRTPPFCDCQFPQSTELTTYTGDIHELVSCKCGEDDCSVMEWQWDESNGSVDCILNGPNVTFHPIYSQGTTIIRGNKRLETKMIHYWEIRILTCLSGTDVMIGIGTDKFEQSSFQYQFASALGIDDQSWGLSYRGETHHKSEHTPYGNSFTQGCIVGIYLDLNRGYLEYFLNRRSLGIAFTNIPTDPTVNLYPMICSTSAKSAMQLINSISRKETLQFRAFRELSKQPKQLEELRQMPGLKSLVDAYWFLAPPTRYSHISKKNEIPLEDEVVLSSMRKLRKLKYKEFSTTDEDIDVEDLYRNAHKITIREIAETDEDPDCLYYML